MLRHLLYSISLHLFLFLVLYSDTILYKPQRSLDLTNNQKENVSSNKLDKIKKNLFNGNKLEQLTLKQKIDLYENYDKIKSVKVVKYDEIKSRLKENIIFSVNKKTNSDKNNNKSLNNSINKNDYNIVTKESHKLYVAESKLTKKQIKKINQQNELKEKIREQIKKADSKKEIEKTKQANLDELLKDLNKDLVAINNEAKTEFKVINNIQNDVKQSDALEELLDLMEIDDVDKLIEAKDEISNGDINTIFTKEDYENMIDRKNSIYELSFREKSNIQKQIKICYKNAVLKTRKNSSLVMSAQIKLSRNGQIDMNNIIFNIENEKNIDNIDRDEYFTTIENIKLALVYCNPLRGLPGYKYNIWKNMNLIFNN